MCRRESIRPYPAAWNILQLRHCASQGRQSASAFSLDEGFESFTNQRRFLRYPGELLCNADEVVIECNGCSHRKLQAPVIALNDVIFCVCIWRVTPQRTSPPWLPVEKTPSRSGVSYSRLGCPSGRSC